MQLENCQWLVLPVWVSSGHIRGETHEPNEQVLEKDHQAIKSYVLKSYSNLFSSFYSPEFYLVSIEMSLEIHVPKEKVGLDNRV